MFRRAARTAKKLRHEAVLAGAAGKEISEEEGAFSL